MNEWIPVIAGGCVGAVSVLALRGVARAVAGIAGVAIAAVVAAAMSGELGVSWGYLFVDVLEGAAGYCAGAAVALVITRTSARGSRL